MNPTLPKESFSTLKTCDLFFQLSDPYLFICIKNSVLGRLKIISVIANEVELGPMMDISGLNIRGIMHVDK